MHNTKKILFATILIFAAYATHNSSCAATRAIEKEYRHPAQEYDIGQHVTVYGGNLQGAIEAEPKEGEVIGFWNGGRWDQPQYQVRFPDGTTQYQYTQWVRKIASK